MEARDLGHEKSPRRMRIAPPPRTVQKIVAQPTAIGWLYHCSRAGVRRYHRHEGRRPHLPPLFMVMRPTRGGAIIAAELGGHFDHGKIDMMGSDAGRTPACPKVNQHELSPEPEPVSSSPIA
jgi:hypothetical protein